MRGGGMQPGAQQYPNQTQIMQNPARPRNPGKKKLNLLQLKVIILFIILL